VRLQKNLNLFDLLLRETSPWEALRDEHKTAAIDILARIIANTIQSRHDQENNHE
jgi:hypothetical protein